MTNSLRVILLFIVMIVSAIAYQSCSNSSSNEIAEVTTNKPVYVGDKACISCHKSQVEKWEGSHHFHAMEVPTEQSVLADWGGEFTADEQRFSFFKKGGQYFVTVQEFGKESTYEVAYTFGIEPLQQYLIKADKGRLQTLRATWDSDKGEWFNQYAGDVITPDDWMHFTNQSANWNGMCASCHSTDVEVDYNASTDSYNTSFTHINVSCESCHGPASIHIELAEANTYRPDSSGFNIIEDEVYADVNMCGGCHARREQLFDNVQPGTPFHEAYNIALIDERNYHPDGQIREEDYVLGSFLSSKMYNLGVRCADCHDSHSMQLKFEGNTLCRQCHEPEYESAAHHFHEVGTEAAECVNCHMDGRTYMGNDYRRDHSFRIPRPDQSVAYGTPNACISCHTDKSDEWANSAVNKWYGAQRPDHFSNKLLAGWLGNKPEQLVSLANDEMYPAISRATAIFYLSQSDLSAVAQNARKWVKDRHPEVRNAALSAIRAFPAEERLSYLNRAFKDEYRSVRIAAFKSSLDIDAAIIPPAYQQDYSKVKQEYEEYLDMIADFPEGQGQLGNYYFEKGDYARSIEAYRKALNIDSLRAELRTNLAIVYNTAGQNSKALIQLNRVLAQQPSAQTFYLRGLLKAEMNDLKGAALDMEEALAINSNNPSYWYNLTLTYSQMGQRQKARLVLTEALGLFPNNQRLRSLISAL